MISRRLIGFVFIFLVFFSVSLVVGAFFTWNDPFEYDAKKFTGFERFHVDECYLKNKVVVSGWAYTPDFSYARYSVFVEKINGGFIKLETFSEERKDIQTILKLKDHQVSGFEASYRGFDSDYTGLISIQAESNYDDGRAYSVQYRCKG
ncbi:hypothetical protein ACPUEK_05975 [Marinomonas gallaica]|uniref:hypothetical protein n=1 Tax=Marinomonas gallaica TaxID=1806667 RepID=UPI003CE50EDD